jgi:hypothetical protein
MTDDIMPMVVYDAVLVFCDKLTKMVHLAACTKETDAFETAKLVRDRVFAVHGMPESIISDRDARFTGHFWKALMKLLGVNHKLSTAFHPQTDGQTELHPCMLCWASLAVLQVCLSQEVWLLCSRVAQTQA